MKKFIFLIAASLTLAACNTLRDLDTEGFTSTQNIIYYKGEKVAELSNIEYSLDNKKIVKELTFKLVNQNHGDKVRNLIYYISQKHPGWEIEIDLPLPPGGALPE